MGSGKLLCFEIAPFLFEAICVGVHVVEMQSTASSVCLVVAPLASLMNGQVSSLRNRGIAATMIGPESSAAEMIMKGIQFMMGESTWCLEAQRGTA